ncbi:MAG: hypothetical protein HY816_20925 [Candidatus Wallbacteria bacterium]|nr:hypothetical protein [Candidatus Wallbacteria bacterium]
MRSRLTLILAAAVVALVVTSSMRPGGSSTQGLDAQGASLMQVVPSDHWIYPALRELGGEGNIPMAQGLSGSKPVTRFEMAVLLSRIMEKLEAAGGPGKLSAEKVAVLDKLAREFRTDLDAIGSDINSMKSRIDELAKKIENGTPGNGALVKQVFDANQKLDAVTGKSKDQDQKLDWLTNKVTVQSGQIAEGQKQIKVYAEVLAKLLVKTARLEKSPAAGEASGGLTRANLNDLRSLIKDVAVDFERRIARLERPVGAPVHVPAATRMPAPEGDPDPDHVLESEPAATEPPVGPGAASSSQSQSYIPDDRI